MLANEVFANLQGDRLSRVTCVEGDMASPALGISEEDRVTMRSHVNVIINCAAIVSWNRTLDEYINMHVGGMARYVVMNRDLWALGMGLTKRYHGC
jgi:thioester reductase-like protein